MTKKVAGYRRKLYIGTAGTTAATLITSAVDVDFNPGVETHDTTTRGDGQSVPKHTESPHERTAEITFSFRFKETDADQATIIAAIQDAEPLAIKLERFHSGAVEFNGDCYLSGEAPGPLADSMTLTVTCTPTDDAGRIWSHS